MDDIRVQNKYEEKLKKIKGKINELNVEV